MIEFTERSRVLSTKDFERQSRLADGYGILVTVIARPGDKYVHEAVDMQGSGERRFTEAVVPADNLYVKFSGLRSAISGFERILKLAEQQRKP